ncbi:MAG: 50S ribosomal protein L25 [Deltaproteobacteria bacterium]|nr:50S ribosomal protein L25 [Deltaproteobacteria bacterium]
METVVLHVEARQVKSKGDSGRLRRNGKVPAVFYGPGKAGEAICVDAREFRFKLDGLEGSHLIQLNAPGSAVNEKLALLKEVQRHPVTSAPVHIDFYEVDVNKVIEVTVPLHFVGKAAGVTAGGVLQSLRREITVECLPREIPEFVEIDVTQLALHGAVHISQITLPAGVKAVYDTDDAVVIVASLAVAATPAATEAAEGEAAAPAAAPVASAAKTEKK